MKDLLVGSTGFVGKNLIERHSFDAVCHSTDVERYYGSRPDLCVYCGVPAAMYIANADPNADLRIMECARENLRKISPRKAVLISTIAIYGDEKGIDETFSPDLSKLHAYGRNRLLLEKWVRQDFPDALILHLPALYGTGLKKNFLFDLHTIIPAMLREEKYLELADKSPLIQISYTKDLNGFYVLNGNAGRSELMSFFKKNDFNALSFTDSRSRYQFYDLRRLWADIEISLGKDLRIMNLATPPVTAADVYEAVTGKDGWSNELKKTPYDYDMRTKNDNFFGGADGYIISREDEMDSICRFMKNWHL